MAEPNFPPLDWTTSAIAIGDGEVPDETFLVELLLIFAKEVQEHSRLMMESEDQLKSLVLASSGSEAPLPPLRNSILKSLRQQIHAVKGSASMLKLTRLTRISTELELVSIKAQDTPTTFPTASSYNTSNDDSNIINLLDEFFSEVLKILNYIEAGSYLDRRMLDKLANANEIVVKLKEIKSETFEKSLKRRPRAFNDLMTGILTRDFIRGCLYEGSRSYFHLGDVIAKSNPINFRSLLGRNEYETAVRAHYDAGGRGWLTPSEIFQPYYGQALAHKLVTRLNSYSSKSLKSSHPLIIYEVGGGSGVAASDILDWLRRVKPSIYASCEYTILEISQGLNKRQQEVLSKRGHSHRAKSVLVDATNIYNSRSIVPRDDRFCIVIGLEVLDNLPHDKVVVVKEELNGLEQLLETRVIDLTENNPTRRQILSESYKPLSDTLIQTVNDLWEVEQRAQDKEGQLSLREKIISSVRKRGFIHSILFGLHTALLVTGKTAISLSGMHPPGSRLASEARLASLRPPFPRNFKSARFLPTGCLSLLLSLEDTFPQHELLLSDFDVLPPASLQLSTESVERDTKVTCYAPADKCEPLVSSKNASNSQDHVTYLSAARGTADIFFETDFNLLARMINHVRLSSKTRLNDASENQCSIVTSSEFMEANVDAEGVGKTRSGWNPLLEDFTNVKVLST